MKTSIEKNLSRITGKIEAIETRVDAMQHAIPLPSAFSDLRGEHVADMIAAAGLDNLASAASRLRALHSGHDDAAFTASNNPFGKPAVTPIIIQGDFVEVQGD